MNQVFMPRPVGGNVGQKQRTQGASLTPALALAAGGAVGGAVMTIVLSSVGHALMSLDTTKHKLVIFGFAACIGVLVVGFQGAQRFGPLPQRGRQVPRRWLHWRRPWLTALGFGALLGGGAFTYLRFATMYSLGLLALLAPDLASAAALGALYGANRNASVLYTSLWRHFGGTGLPTLGRATAPLLTLAGIAAPLWAAVRIGS